VQKTMDVIVRLTRAVVSGLLDGLKVQNTIYIFFESKTIRNRSVLCFFLNGFIFLGSLFLVEKVVSPILKFLLIASDENDSQQLGATVGHGMSLLLMWMYYLLWIYPIYGISFILSAIWYQDIADTSFVVLGGKRPALEFTFQRWVNSMAEEVYRLLLIWTFCVQILAFSFIPYVGRFLAALQCCWLHSLYSFEYKWVLQGWTLEQRLEFLETRWAYFAGFGIPVTLLTYFFPRFISNGLFACTLPIYIILAILGDPQSHASETAKDEQAYRIPIFSMAKVLNALVLKYFKARTSKKTS